MDARHRQRADPEARSDDALSYANNGVFWDEAPPKSTRFVIVSLIDAFDEPVYGGRAIEDALYLVEYRELKPTVGVGYATMAAARIDELLDDGTIPLPAGYTLMAVFRESRTRVTEVDEAEESIRWNRRGGRYRVQVSLDVVPRAGSRGSRMARGDRRRCQLLRGSGGQWSRERG